MTRLVPDVLLENADRTVVIDAKYKAHLHQLGRGSWSTQPAHLSDSHRADLHQALAYAARSSRPRVDAVLAYPELGDNPDPPSATAEVASGHQGVRLHLLPLPFGFKNEHGARRSRDLWLRHLRQPG